MVPTIFIDQNATQYESTKIIYHLELLGDYIVVKIVEVGLGNTRWETEWHQGKGDGEISQAF